MTGSATGEDPSFERRVFLILACLAVICAFLAGLRTVSAVSTFSAARQKSTIGA
ncbi:MAG: hypothetical protein ABSD98_16465 [Candidatus Korobacteraceae bacterium]